jgi:alcohol dehydrogenase (NADP+)
MREGYSLQTVECPAWNDAKEWAAYFYQIPKEFAFYLSGKAWLIRDERSRIKADAKRLGADRFVLTTNPEAFKENANYFDFVVDTVSAPHDIEKYLGTLNVDGVLIMVGLPPEPLSIPAHSFVQRRRSVAGSMIGGIAETQEMLDFCAAHNIVSDVEVIPIQQINEAYEKTIKGQVKYRFVIDIASLKESNG